MDDMKRGMAYVGAQIEETNRNVKAILEMVVPMQQGVIQLKKDVARIPEIEKDIKTIKAVLKVQSLEINSHDRRLTRLESKSA